MTSVSKRRTNSKPAPAAFPAVIAPPDLVAATRVPTKAQQLISLLLRDGGASIAELATTLGWLPHTTRAAMSGLRKKGQMIDPVKVVDTMRFTLRSKANA